MNVHNVTAVIKCILPYHETALFVRVVRLCKLGEEWLFLHNVKKTKTRMDRAALVQNCLKDSHLLTFICELVVRLSSFLNIKYCMIMCIHDLLCACSPRAVLSWTPSRCRCRKSI